MEIQLHINVKCTITVIMVVRQTGKGIVVAVKSGARKHGNDMKQSLTPEWHHVSFNTLANLDFDMLDTKRQKYMTIYKLARNTIKSMYKCKSITQYRSLTNRLITYVHSAYRHDRCAIALVQYVRAKIADVNVNCNIQSSVESEEFGYHESRRYN